MDKSVPGTGETKENSPLKFGGMTRADGYAVSEEPELVIDGEYVDPNGKYTSLIIAVRGQLPMTIHQRAHALKQLQKLLETANKWEVLDSKIAEYYKEDDPKEDEFDDGLIGIGEISAKAFGYL